MVRPPASTGSSSGSSSGSGRRPSSSNEEEEDGPYSIDEIRRLRPALTTTARGPSSSDSGANVNVGGGRSQSKKSSQTAKASRGGTSRTRPSSSNNANNLRNRDANMDAFRHHNRRERAERARDIPATLSIVRPFPATAPTAAAASSPNATGSAAGAHTTSSSNGAAARTPYGGKMMAGPEANINTPHGNQMRRADAGHTPGAAFYLPPSLTDPTSTFAATNHSTTFAALHTHVAAQPSRRGYDDGVSPLAFGAEARPVRTKAQQLAREEYERNHDEQQEKRREEWERRREGMMMVGRNNEKENEKENQKRGGVRGSRKNTKNNAKTKDNTGRRRTFEVLRKKRSDAYAVDADGLLVVQRTVSEDNHARINRISSCSAKGTKAASSSSSKKSKAGRSAKMMTKTKPARKAVAASLRTLGKKGLRAAKQGGVQSHRAATSAMIVIRSKMANQDEEERRTLQRNGSGDAAATPALPVDMARAVDDGTAVAPCSALASTTPIVPRRHQPLHNFRRLSMIDLREGALDYQVPTTVKKRVAAAKAVAVAAGHAGAVGGSAAVAVAYEGARVGGDRMLRSAKKAGRRAAANAGPAATVVCEGARVGGDRMLRSAKKAGRKAAAALPPAADQFEAVLKHGVVVARSKAVAAGHAGLAAAGPVAAVAGAELTRSAKKVGRSAAKAQARVRRHIAHHLDQARAANAYAGERRKCSQCSCCIFWLL